MSQQGPPPGGDPAPGIGAVPLPPGYVLVERLGSGGFATVWLAEQGRLGRRVAVKLLGETLDDAERERRFLAECQAIGRLSGHPAVVTVHDAGTTEAGHPYLVMEHLPGGSLHDRLRGGPLPWAEVLHIGVSVADALAAAHLAGILHRDVKPANVLLDENGAPKLGDFGIARLAEGTNTVTGTLVGTIPFTPPEVLSGHRPAPTADVWALGATLHTLLAGTSPFAGHRDEPPAAAIARVLRSEPPTLPPAVPAALRDVVRDMLHADPAARPQSAAEVVARLQQIQSARGLPVTPARATRGAAATPPPPAADATVVGVPVTDTPPGPFPIPGAAPATPPAAWTPPPPPAPTGPGADDPTVIGRAAAPAAGDPWATAVQSVPAATPPPPPAPGAWPAAGPTPPPGGPTTGAGPRSKKPLLVALVVLVLLAVAGGVAVVLLGGDDGDDTADPPGATTTATDPETGLPQPGADQIESVWGLPLTVPSGVSVDQVAAVNEAEIEVDCSGTNRCSATALDGGGAVLAYSEDGGETLQLEKISDEGAQEWKVPVDTPADTVAVGDAGPVVLLATIEGGRRMYRAFDPASGEEAWGAPATFPTSDRPIRPSAQPSPSAMVVMLTNAYDGRAGAAAVDYASGEVLWDEPGRVLSTDEDHVYVALDGAVVARDIRDGSEAWRQDAVDVDNDGESPAGRLGVVLGDTLFTVAGGNVVTLATGSGDPVWDEPISLSGETDLGAPLVVSAAGGLVVVAAEGGDAAFDPVSGTVAWQEAREPLVVEGEVNVWYAADGLLVAGQQDGLLRSISTENGGVVETIDLSGATIRSLTLFVGGFAVLSDEGAYAIATDDLTSRIWQHPDAADARTVVAVADGLLVLGEGGIQLVRALEG